MKAYRYMEDNYSDGDLIKLFELEVIKQTPCGFWVSTPYDNKKKHFINDRAFKKYAHLNKKDALISFISRKESQVSIYENRLNNAELALEQGEKLLKEVK